MWWWIAGFAVLLGLGVLFPTPRERAISALSPKNRKWYPHDETAEARVLPKSLSDRDTAYVLEYYKRFGSGSFFYGQVRGKRLRRNLMETYQVCSGPLDDKAVLGSRLPELGLLNSPRPGVYMLTAKALKLAEQLSA